MITLMNEYDNMFEIACTHLVNPVNTRGTMGAGVAKLIGNMYPEACSEYHRRCWQRDYEPGNLIEEYTATSLLRILHFPTKVNWQNPSKLEYIELGFEAMVRKYAHAAHLVFNIPALGCGLGGLHFDDVKGLAYDILTEGSFQVNLFPPKE